VSATLFRAAERLITDPTLGWGSILGSSLQTVVVGGDHLSIMDPPHVDRLVASLVTELDLFNQRCRS
jgi:hypothetical protein